jgi:hypothetical protein
METVSVQGAAFPGRAGVGRHRPVLRAQERTGAGHGWSRIRVDLGLI